MGRHAVIGELLFMRPPALSVAPRSSVHLTVRPSRASEFLEIRKP